MKQVLPVSYTHLDVYKRQEENRLLAVDENGFVSNYWYDANGERTVKTSGENEAIYVNSEFSGGNTEMCIRDRSG